MLIINIFALLFVYGAILFVIGVILNNLPTIIILTKITAGIFVGIILITIIKIIFDFFTNEPVTYSKDKIDYKKHIPRQGRSRTYYS